MKVFASRLLWGLDGHTPVPIEDTGEFPEYHARCVGLTKIGERRVSTVFLGVDMNLGAEPPLFFETIVFGERGPELTIRYPTWESAAAGHDRLVKELRR